MHIKTPKFQKNSIEREGNSTESKDKKDQSNAKLTTPFNPNQVPAGTVIPESPNTKKVHSKVSSASRAIITPNSLNTTQNDGILNNTMVA